MKKILKYLLFITLCVSYTSCLTSGKIINRKIPKISNVILMIGDGMGLSSVYSAMSVSDPEDMK